MTSKWKFIATASTFVLCWTAVSKFNSNPQFTNVLWKAMLVILVCFILLFSGAVLFKKLAPWIKQVSNILWTNRIIVIMLLFLYMVLWKLDQGQDLMINLNTNFWGPGVFYVIISILAALNWHLPKLYVSNPDKIDTATFLGIKKLETERTYSNSIQVTENTVNDNELKKTNSNIAYLLYVPRLLGALTFIIPACAILNAIKVFKIPFELFPLNAPITFIITVVVYFFVIHFKLIEKVFCAGTEAFKSVYVWCFLALLFSVVIFLGFLNDRSPVGLTLMVLGLYLCSIGFLIFVTLRKDLNEASPINKLLTEKYISQIIFSSAFLISVAFILLSVYPLCIIKSHSSLHWLTISIVVSGLIMYDYLFSGLLMWGKRKKINIVTYLLVASIAMAAFNDSSLHDVKKTETLPTKVLTLDEYTKGWLDSRQDEIKTHSSKKPFPVFIVNTWGGGIRASVWTALAVAQLDSMVNSKLPGKTFQDFVFAYSGASGGTVGAAILCANKNLAANNKPAKSKAELNAFFHSDFLTPVLIGLLGRDIFFSLIGASYFDDRSAVQDDLWNYRFSDSGDVLNTPFDNIWYHDGVPHYKVPLLFSNTSNVDEGKKGIMAPVVLNEKDFPYTIRVRELMRNNEQIKLITGAMLSARFPYMSPAAKFNDNMDTSENNTAQHFIDGGLKDNSGAETASEIYNVFNRVLQNQCDSATQANVKIYMLSLDNAPPHDDLQKEKNLFELTAPITALNNSWVANAYHAEIINRNKFDLNYFCLKPLATTITIENGDSLTPVLPLGWQISNYAIQRLNESLNHIETNNKLSAIAGKCTN